MYYIHEYDTEHYGPPTYGPLYGSTTLDGALEKAKRILIHHSWKDDDMVVVLKAKTKQDLKPKDYKERLYSDTYHYRSNCVVGFVSMHKKTVEGIEHWTFTYNPKGSKIHYVIEDKGKHTKRF